MARTVALLFLFGLGFSSLPANRACASAGQTDSEFGEVLKPLVDELKKKIAEDASVSLDLPGFMADNKELRRDTGQLKLSLRRLIRKENRTVVGTEDGPDFTLTGELRISREKDKQGVELKFVLSKGKQKIDGDFTLLIAKQRLCNHILGGSHHFGPNDDPDSQKHNVGIILEKADPPKETDKPALPQFVRCKVNGNESKSRIRSVEKSPYSVEVLATTSDLAPDGKNRKWDTVAPREITPGPRGEPTVAFKPGDVYALRIYYEPKDEVVAKKNGHAAAVEIFLDGLSDFHFSQLRESKDRSLPLYKHWIIDPVARGSIIPGWHSTNEKSLSFLVGELGKDSEGSAGVPAMVKPKEKIGLISFNFYPAWKKDATTLPKELDGLMGKLETWPGSEVWNPVREATDVKVGPRCIDQLVIHYNR